MVRVHVKKLQSRPTLNKTDTYFHCWTQSMTVTHTSTSLKTNSKRV